MLICNDRIYFLCGEIPDLVPQAQKNDDPRVVVESFARKTWA